MTDSEHRIGKLEEKTQSLELRQVSYEEFTKANIAIMREQIEQTKEQIKNDRERMNRMDARMDKMDERIDKMDAKMDGLSSQMHNLMTNLLIAGGAGVLAIIVALFFTRPQ